MGIFRKKSPEEERLSVVSGSIAQAVAKSRFGIMPPDFANDVVEASREELPRLYGQVLATSGPKIANKASVKHARMVAEIWSKDQRVNQAAFVDEVGNLIKNLVGQ